jgi:hypothetical protein
MANSKSVSSSGNATSDVMSPPGDAVQGWLMLKTDNDGTPASGDVVKWTYECTTGDPDADPDSTDEHVEEVHGPILDRHDTNAKDPAKSGPFSIPPLDYQLYADNESSGRAQTVSAQTEWLLKDGTTSKQQVTWT